jgi:hypothetical protein
MIENKILGVEIFAAGTWNGDNYTVADLDSMVMAFEETSPQFKPFLKLGHDEKQKLLQKDGLPAAGWINKVYRVGEKLFADFVDIPAKVMELITNKAYRKVSSEIYWNMVVGEKKYPYLLGAVALLGADTPAVTSLNDILAFYGLKEQTQEVTSKIYEYESQFSHKEPRMEKTEQEIRLELELKAAQEKLEALEVESKQYSVDADALKSELETLKADRDALRAESLRLAKEAADAQLEKYTTELVAEKLITPAMKPYVMELLADEKKEYSVAEKKFSKPELVKELLKLHTATAVNTEEGSEVGQETEAGNSDEVLAGKIEKYMNDNKCSYKMAYKAIVAEIKPRESAVMNNMVQIDN